MSGPPVFFAPVIFWIQELLSQDHVPIRRALRRLIDEVIRDVPDHAQLINAHASPREGEQRYSRAEIAEAVPVVISGSLPADAHSQTDSAHERFQQDI